MPPACASAAPPSSPETHAARAAAGGFAAAAAPAAALAAAVPAAAAAAAGAATPGNGQDRASGMGETTGRGLRMGGRGVLACAGIGSMTEACCNCCCCCRCARLPEARLREYGCSCCGCALLAAGASGGGDGENKPPSSLRVSVLARDPCTSMCVCVILSEIEIKQCKYKIGRPYTCTHPYALQILTHCELEHLVSAAQRDQTRWNRTACAFERQASDKLEPGSTGVPLAV
eukprot:782104-Pelagomonas_calceolata.AAC.2